MTTRNWVIRVCAVGSLLVFALAAALPSQAKAEIVRYVKVTTSGSGDCSSWADACALQTALTGAGAVDEIWVSGGTYLPTAGTDPNITFQLKGGTALYGGFAGTETQRSQRSPADHLTTLSGNIGAPGTADNSYHVVTGANGAVIDGFTITLGNADGNPWDTYDPKNWGGGVYHGSGSMKLENIILADNRGGSAGAGGGGMYNGATATLIHVTFSKNGAWNGGGLFNEGSATLSNVVFSHNSAYNNGGGMNTAGGNATLTDVTFDFNSAGFTGGGLYVWSSPLLHGVTFSNNSADSDGGGMYAYGSSSPTLINVTFSQNSAGRNGGGVATDTGGNSSIHPSSYPVVVNATFNGNTAVVNGGAWDSSAPGVSDINHPTIVNSIFWGNTSPIGEIGWHRSVVDVTYSVVQGGYPGVGNLTADPKLGLLANYGGFTQTIPLGEGSSAINAGADVSCQATDQRGVPRPQGPQCDIGAFEVDLTPPTVSSITRLDPNPSALESVRFLVTFSEPVTGVDLDDFAPAASGILGAAPGEVSGSGSAYTVAVCTGSGDGEIRLDVPSGASIQDIALNPLDGLPFTGGETYTITKPRFIFLAVIKY